MRTLKTMRKKNPKAAKRQKRAMGIRKRLSGTAVRPRMTVYRSAKHIYVQAVDDVTGRTLASASTQDKTLKANLTGMKKAEQAGKVGALIGERLKDAGVTNAVFDRNGFRFHGRVAAIAAAVREAGIKI